MLLILKINIYKYYMSYIYPIPTNIKKNYIIYLINNSTITSATLIDVLIYSNQLNILFSAALSGGDKTTLDNIVSTYNSSSDPYPIYTEEYYIKVSSSDKQANFLSSSLISSNSITYSILRRGSDELYQAAVADPLTINSLILNSSLTVNNIQGINSTDINITNYLQYKNRGIILNSSITVSVSPITNTILKWNNFPLKNNGILYTGSDIRVSVPGWYSIFLQSVGNSGNANNGRGLKIFKNNITSSAIGESFGRYETGGTPFVINVSILDYNTSSSIYIPAAYHTLSGASMCNFNVSTSTEFNIFACSYLGN